MHMVPKGQWVVLPAHIALALPGIRTSPPGGVPQRDCRPRWIGNYTWSQVNQEAVPIFASESMQFGHALERLLREILLANLPMALSMSSRLTLDLSDGFFCRVKLNANELGLVFPTRPGEEPLVAIPLVQPWSFPWDGKQPSGFLCCHGNHRRPGQRQAASNFLLAAALSSRRLGRGGGSSANQAASPPTPVSIAVDVPIERDPSLPQDGVPLQYINIFVDGFISLAHPPFFAACGACCCRR